MKLDETGLVVSASLVLVATSAMASVRGEVVEVPKDVDIPEGLARKIDAALQGRTVREAVSAVFNILTSCFSEDDQVLDERYFSDPELKLAANPPGRQDSTDSGEFLCYTNCYSNCHGACHGACHGSRGWR